MRGALRHGVTKNKGQGNHTSGLYRWNTNLLQGVGVCFYDMLVGKGDVYDFAFL